uniref:CSON009147 protein n=1 Tax=Culicoides sonorensis TaxID=179676 RepID=A0A336LNH1_CULSO
MQIKTNKSKHINQNNTNVIRLVTGNNVESVKLYCTVVVIVSRVIDDFIKIILTLTLIIAEHSESKVTCSPGKATSCVITNIVLKESNKNFILIPHYSQIMNIGSISFVTSKVEVLSSNICDTLRFITKFNASNLELVAVDENTFMNCSNLIEVSLSDNFLEVLPSNVFEQNVNLRFVFLSNNLFKTIEMNLFQNNIYLTLLNLDENQLRNISFSNNSAPFQNLTTFNVAKNWLSDFDVEQCVNVFPNLKKIKIQDNLLLCNERNQIISDLVKHNIQVNTDLGVCFNDEMARMAHRLKIKVKKLTRRWEKSLNATSAFETLSPISGVLILILIIIGIFWMRKTRKSNCCVKKTETEEDFERDDNYNYCDSTELDINLDPDNENDDTDYYEVPYSSPYQPPEYFKRMSTRIYIGKVNSFKTMKDEINMVELRNKNMLPNLHDLSNTRISDIQDTDESVSSSNEENKLIKGILLLKVISGQNSKREVRCSPGADNVDNSMKDCAILNINLKASNKHFQLIPHHNKVSLIYTIKFVNSNIEVLTSDVCDALPYIGVFTGNNIKLVAIDENAFENCLVVFDINLYNNSLTTLPSKVFAKNIDLALLTLNNNSITHLPEDLLLNNVELRDLILFENNLTSLPSKLFSNTKNLDYLDLDDNQLTDISFLDDMPVVNSLITIRLAMNWLSEIDVAKITRVFPNLAVIRLKDNGFLCERQKEIRNQLNQTNIRAEKDLGNCIENKTDWYELKIKRETYVAERQKASPNLVVVVFSSIMGISIFIIILFGIHWLYKNQKLSCCCTDDTNYDYDHYNYFIGFSQNTDGSEITTARNMSDCDRVCDDEVSTVNKFNTFTMAEEKSKIWEKSNNCAMISGQNSKSEIRCSPGGENLDNIKKDCSIQNVNLKASEKNFQLIPHHNDVDKIDTIKFENSNIELFSNTKNLDNLDLDSNQITDISFLDDMPVVNSLTFLHLARNWLSDINVGKITRVFPNLTVIRLKDNEFLCERKEEITNQLNLAKIRAEKDLGNCIENKTDWYELKTQRETYVAERQKALRLNESEPLDLVGIVLASITGISIVILILLGIYWLYKNQKISCCCCKDESDYNYDHYNYFIGYKRDTDASEINTARNMSDCDRVFGDEVSTVNEPNTSANVEETNENLREGQSKIKVEEKSVPNNKTKRDTSVMRAWEDIQNVFKNLEKQLADIKIEND